MHLIWIVAYKCALSTKAKKMTKKYDFLIIGSGVAGMSYALKVARAKKGKIAIVCKT